jgi:hypothetical protein
MPGWWWAVITVLMLGACGGTSMLAQQCDPLSPYFSGYGWCDIRARESKVL